MDNHIKLKNVYINNGKIYLESDEKITNLVLKGKNLDLYFNNSESIIDIRELILQKKDFLIIQSRYNLYGTNISGSEKKLIIDNITTNFEVYITKDLKVEVDNFIYSVNLCIDNKSNLILEIQCVSVDNEYIAEIEMLNINHEKLELSLDLSSFDNIENSELIIIGKKDSEVKTYNANGFIDKKASFSIDLNQLVEADDYKARLLLKLNELTYFIKYPEGSRFQEVDICYNQLLKVVSLIPDENNNLLLKFSLNMSIKPVVTSIENQDGLIIKGQINSNLNIFHNTRIKSFVKFVSGDGKFSDKYEISIEQGKFCIEISKDKILDLKDSYQGKWKISIQVMNHDELLCESTMSNKKKRVLATKRTVLFSGGINYLDQVINSALFIDRGSHVIQLSVKNTITVSKILSIIVKKNQLKVKFRIIENLEKIANSESMQVNLNVNGTTLNQNKIKIIGKKTFIVEYNTKDADTISECMYKKGTQIVTICGDKKGISKVSDIDRDTIFNTFWQRVQHSKNYKILVRRMYKDFLTKLPIKENWIVYESFLGRNMSDSPKYIYQYLESEYKGKYKHIWVFNHKRDDLPKEIKQVKRFSFEHLYYIARSKFWVNNMRQPTWFIKRERQIFLATWHGTPLKKLVFDIEEIHSANKDYKQEFYTQSRVWDYLISANEYSTEIFRRAFKFDNTILELGYPRNDLMYSENQKQITLEIKNKLGIPLDKKVVLYAPTWRDDEVMKPGKYKFQLELDLKRLRKELGNEYFFILRTHYFIANHIDVDGLEDFVYNASKYDDITELYLLSDVLITDYSSVFFDYANLKRPTLFFTYDLEKYRDVLRGFYLDLETEGPGPIVMNNDEIINELSDFNKLVKTYKSKIDKFYNRFCSWDDGEAAKRIAEHVIVKHS